MEIENKQPVRLTQYSRGAGCGCKIAPQVLEQILHSPFHFDDQKLLVGNNTHDDAAVYDLGDENCLISTTDFFMPIVDDAKLFGKIAAANALSDVYAMGGKPILAIAILGWPVEKLPAELAKEVTEGAAAICAEAGIALAGGHSIDSAEPFFGLAVNGIVRKNCLKKNNTAQPGDLLFLTKPLGVGILSTAQKRNVLEKKDYDFLISQLTRLNKAGEALGKILGVTAMTDVTGFGLAGHLIEMADGSGLSVNLNYSRLWIYENIQEYLSKRIVPDATYRNWNSYSSKIAFEKGVNVMEAFSILPDPQTNGGLLITVNPSSAEDVKKVFHEFDLDEFAEPVGQFIMKKEKTIYVQ